MFVYFKLLYFRFDEAVIFDKRCGLPHFPDVYGSELIFMQDTLYLIVEYYVIKMCRIYQQCNYFYFVTVV